jgi:hypothetical protein
MVVIAAAVEEATSVMKNVLDTPEPVSLTSEGV